MSDSIERVVLALDATVEAKGAIATAARFAARAKTRLHAVFVEDQQLLSLAELAVARQIVPGVKAAPLSSPEVELHLRAAADRVRADVLEAARGHALECSFEIVRGAAEAALATASDRDLVVAGAFARPFAGHFRLHSGWFAAHQRAPGPFLLVRESSHAQGGVAVFLRQRSPASGRLVRTASRLAALGDGRFAVICSPSLAASPDFGRWVEEQIGETSPRPQIESAPPDPAELPRRLAELGCGLIAIGADAAEGGLESLREATERLGCDVLVVP
jgi:hypothetical protein